MAATKSSAARAGHLNKIGLSDATVEAMAASDILPEAHTVVVPTFGDSGASLAPLVAPNASSTNATLVSGHAVEGVDAATKTPDDASSMARSSNTSGTSFPAGNVSIKAPDSGTKSLTDPMPTAVSHTATASDAVARTKHASVADAVSKAVGPTLSSCIVAAATNPAPADAKASFAARVASHVASTVGTSLAPVGAPKAKPVSINSGTSPPSVDASNSKANPAVVAPAIGSAPHREASKASSMSAKVVAMAVVHALSTANASGERAMAVTDTQATDALAAEALDAADGALPSAADAIEAANEAAKLGSGVDDSVSPSGFDSYVSTTGSMARKPGFQSASKAPLAMHMQASAAPKCSVVTPSGLDSDAFSTVDSTVKSARAANSVGGQGARESTETGVGAHNASSTGAVDIQTCGKPGFQILPEAPLGTHMQAPAVSPSVLGSTTQPAVPAPESGSRSSTGIAPRRDPHPFLTTENAKAYAQHPRMEGLLIALDEECPSEIQNLPWDVFLAPRERGASLQEEHMAAHCAAKQLRDGELIRCVCDDWNCNSVNSYTPNDLRHGPITVWPQGGVTPAMRASHGECVTSFSLWKPRRPLIGRPARKACRL